MSRAHHRDRLGIDWNDLWPILAALMLTLIPVLLSGPRSVGAQAGPMTLTVRCRTVADEPVPGVDITVFDAASDVMLVGGRTDDQGLIRFPDMPPAEVLVRLAGSLPDGTAFRHTRQDQRGIWVSLPDRDWVMELRVDTDGLVFPDLGLGNAGAPDGGAATAIAAGALAEVVPTVLPATSVLRPAARPSQRIPTPAPALQHSVADEAGFPAFDITGIGVLVLLIGMIGSVVWIGTRSRV